MNPTTIAYLRRLDLPAEPPSAAALARLHRAHVERVPYETFWIHLAEDWGIDPAASARRVARTTRGGYCYQLNGAFATLLADLGYRVSAAVAGVHDAAGPQASTLRNHAALLVDGCPTEGNPGGRWYVDAGLGDALHDPLPLVTGVYAQGPMRFALSEVAAGGVGDWHFTHDRGGSFGGVSIVDQPVPMSVFADRHRYHRTSAESSFAKTPTAQRRHPTGTALVRGAVFTRTDGAASTTRTCEQLGDWLDVLDGEFGLRLDAPPAELRALWTRVRRAHDTWTAARDSA
ncbi:MAG TPA: arylamine N-acetyltransferase [Mycobacteriales bacterium]